MIFIYVLDFNNRLENGHGLPYRAEDDAAGGHKAGAREADKAAMDEELFMQELEEDEEVRAQVQIFRDPLAAAAAAAAGARAGGAGGGGDEEYDYDDDDVPEVPIESLLDELSLGRNRGGDDEEEEDDDADDGDYGDEDEDMAD